MTAPAETDRRFTFALSAAVAATTVAVGVTAATLLGWFKPNRPTTTAAAAPARPDVVYVPIAPATLPEPVATPDPPREQLALDEPHEREHDHAGHDRDEEHDDD